MRAISSAGRTQGSQSWGQGFDPPIVHHRQESRYFSDFPAFLLCGNVLRQFLIQACEKLPKIKTWLYQRWIWWCNFGSRCRCILSRYILPWGEAMKVFVSLLSIQRKRGRFCVSGSIVTTGSAAVKRRLIFQPCEWKAALRGRTATLTERYKTNEYLNSRILQSALWRQLIGLSP